MNIISASHTGGKCKISTEWKHVLNVLFKKKSLAFILGIMFFHNKKCMIMQQSKLTFSIQQNARFSWP